MNWLDGLSDQIQVPVRRLRSIPLWINESYREKLLKLGPELDAVFSDMPKMNIDPLNFLGLVSDPIQKVFFSPEEWEKELAQKTLFSVEKFHDPYGPDLGPGRNVNFRHFQYKGTGRNNASLRGDWLHSWGGITIPEMIIEVLMEQFLERTYSDCSIPIYGVFRYEDLPHGFLIRSSDFLRCSQIHPLFFDEHKKLLRKKLCESLKAEEKDCFRIIAGKLCDLYLKGLVHYSPTTQNITIDGKFLDHYSLDFFRPSSLLPLFSVDIQSSSGNSLEEILHNDFVIKSTSLDMLRKAFLVVHNSLRCLEVPVPSVESFFQLCEESGICLMGLDESMRPDHLVEFLKEVDPGILHVEKLEPTVTRLSSWAPTHRSIVRVTQKLFSVHDQHGKAIGTHEFRLIMDSLRESFLDQK